MNHVECRSWIESGDYHHIDHITFGKSDNDLSHAVHTTDKRIASWSERANVYKEYMSRSRHEAPRQNTSRRSRGSIEGRLEAPMKGLTQHTNTAINTQSKHWHRSMNRLKIPPNPSTPDLPVYALHLPINPFLPSSSKYIKYYLSIARCLSTRWCWSS